MTLSQREIKLTAKQSPPLRCMERKGQILNFIGEMYGDKKPKVNKKGK